MMYRLRW